MIRKTKRFGSYTVYTTLVVNTKLPNTHKALTDLEIVQPFYTISSNPPSFNTRAMVLSYNFLKCGLLSHLSHKMVLQSWCHKTKHSFGPSLVTSKVSFVHFTSILHNPPISTSTPFHSHLLTLPPQSYSSLSLSDSSQIHSLHSVSLLY